MKLTEYRIEMYRSIIDSGWIKVSPLTTFVGKNESGKTSLLKALHKLNPFKPEPYSMENEWPRGHRNERDTKKIVCRARFSLDEQECQGLTEIAGRSFPVGEIEVTRNYQGDFEVLFPQGVFAEKLRPNQVEEHCQDWPIPTEPVGDSFRQTMKELQALTQSRIREGRFDDLQDLQTEHTQQLQQVRSGACQ